MGVERLLFAMVSQALVDEQLEDGESREVLRLHPKMAPYKLAVAPLTNKVEAEAREAYRTLLQDCHCGVTYVTSGTIGKRYRKQDQIGTP